MSADRHWRGRACSLFLPAGTMRVLGLLMLALMLVSVVALWLGPVRLAWSEWLNLSPLQRFILSELRWPRVQLGLMVGAALAMAGFVLQRLTRVSIAAPSVLGLADGAGLGVVLLLFLGNGLGADIVITPLAMSLAALSGAALILVLLRALARRDRDMEKMVFAGLMMAAICKALISLLLLISPSDMAVQAQIWLIGSLAQANPALNRGLLLAFLLLAVLTLLHYRQLALCHLGDPLMQGLGSRVDGGRHRLYLLAAGLTAVAVAGAGQVGFVGLVVPHLVQRLCPRGVPAQLLGNACAGALLVVGADLLARTLFLPYELPVGILTALLGVPCFLWHYRRGVQR